LSWNGVKASRAWSYYRTIADWFDLLREARFIVERVLEPRS
jgi:hypothetical protein